MIYVFLLAACGSELEPDKGPDLDTIDEIESLNKTLLFSGMVEGFKEAERLGLRFPSADFHPTGFYAAPSAMLELDLSKNESNKDVYLLIGTYSSGQKWNSEPKIVKLNNGSNELNAGDKGGMLYIRYFDQSDESITINFKQGMSHAPYFQKNITSKEEWNKMLVDYQDIPFATLIGDQSIVVVSNDKAKAYANEDQNVLLDNIDRVIQIENEISGMDGTSAQDEPISHKTMFVEYGNTEYYMFAWYYRTAYNYQDGIQFVLDNSKLTNDGWGPWHEVGHTRQMDAWTWNETVEVTVNIYSLAVEKEFGHRSRLSREDIWTTIEQYLSLPESSKSYNHEDVGLFVRLGMFYQLQLAFGGSEFYQKLHKLFRKEQPEFFDDNDRMRLFMVYASRVANVDLTEFFKKWGLKFEDQNVAYIQISALGLDQPTVDPTSLTD